MERLRKCIRLHGLTNHHPTDIKRPPIHQQLDADNQNTHVSIVASESVFESTLHFLAVARLSAASRIYQLASRVKEVVKPPNLSLDLLLHRNNFYPNRVGHSPDGGTLSQIDLYDEVTPFDYGAPGRSTTT